MIFVPRIEMIFVHSIQMIFVTQWKQDSRSSTVYKRLVKDQTLAPPKVQPLLFLQRIQVKRYINIYPEIHKVNLCPRCLTTLATHWSVFVGWWRSFKLCWCFHISKKIHLLMQISLFQPPIDIYWAIKAPGPRQHQVIDRLANHKIIFNFQYPSLNI